MVDLIANALAASMCLFFIIASQQMAPKNKEYILGKLILCARLIPDSTEAFKPSVSIFLIPPGYTSPLHKEEILSLNNADTFLINHQKNMYLDPVNVYTDPKDSLSYSVEINDPMKGAWTIGALYVDANGYPCNKAPVKFEFKAMFIVEKGNNFLTDSTIVINVTHPTEFEMFSVETPLYTEMSE